MLVGFFIMTAVTVKICWAKSLYDRDGNLKFKTVEIGAGSHYIAESFMVIKNQKEWNRVWKTYKGKELSDKSEDAMPPKVDFSQRMLIAVFGGRQPAVCYTIMIEKITQEGEKFVVHVVKNGPDHLIKRPIIMSPCHIVSMPRSNYAVKFVIDGSPSEVMPQEITLE